MLDCFSKLFLLAALNIFIFAKTDLWLCSPISSMAGSDPSTTNYPGKIPPGPDISNDIYENFEKESSNSWFTKLVSGKKKETGKKSWEGPVLIVICSSDILVKISGISCAIKAFVFRHHPTWNCRCSSQVTVSLTSLIWFLPSFCY